MIDRTTHIRVLPTVVSAAALLICTNGPSTFVALHISPPTHGSGSWMFAYPFAVVAIAGAWLLYPTLATTSLRDWPPQLWFVFAFCAWALASVAWSVDRATSLRGALIGLGIAAFGCWFGWRLRVAEHITSIFLATSTAAVASLFLVVFMPKYGKMAPDFYPNTLWQGIFGNRNSLSPVCALGLISIVGFVALRPSTRRALISVPLVVVHVLLLLGSAGQTTMAALVAVIAASGLIMIARTARGRLPGWQVASLIAAIVAVSVALAYLARSDISAGFGRDSSVSGRTEIWNDVANFIALRPFRGYGAYAFWEAPEYTAATYARLGMAYGSAHNSLLEILLGTGVVGVALYLAVILWAIASTSYLTWSQRTQVSWWWSILLTFLLSQNATESFVLWHSYNWVLIVAAAFVVVSPTETDPLARLGRLATATSPSRARPPLRLPG